MEHFPENSDPKQTHEFTAPGGFNQATLTSETKIYWPEVLFWEKWMRNNEQVTSERSAYFYCWRSALPRCVCTGVTWNIFVCHCSTADSARNYEVNGFLCENQFRIRKKGGTPVFILYRQFNQSELYLIISQVAWEDKNRKINVQFIIVIRGSSPKIEIE